MTQMTLFGTTTSPYVRRVRIVAHELGIQTELVDTSTDSGQAALRGVSPIWKVPAARIDDVELFDSAVICQYLLGRFGPGKLAPFDVDDVDTRNQITVTDGALDALINVFYLAKDGIAPEQAPYVAKQSARAASAMAWLDVRVADDAAQARDRFGLAEIALVTTLDWMRFRHAYDVDQHPALVQCVGRHSGRASLAAMSPR